MRILLHIGPDFAFADALQKQLDAHRGDLEAAGILFPTCLGARNHTRLFMASSDPARVDQLRHARGFVSFDAQRRLQEAVRTALTQEITRTQPRWLVLSAHQFGTTLTQTSELERLRDWLSQLSDDVTVMAHVDEPARMLARHYGHQLHDGRTADLHAEFSLLETPSYWQSALQAQPDATPDHGIFPEISGPVHWIDLAALESLWSRVFGPDRVQLFDTGGGFGPVWRLLGLPAPPPGPDAIDHTSISAAWLTRCRLFNDLLSRYLAHHHLSLPRPQRRKILTELKIAGPPLEAGALAQLSDRFAADIHALRARHPGLTFQAMQPDTPAPPWQEADPGDGFRASQYLLHYAPRIRRASHERTRPLKALPPLSPAAERFLRPEARETLRTLPDSRFAPHNALGVRDDTSIGAPTPDAGRPVDRRDRVIIACLKNEAPYILEWIAYHRAMGFDHFVIYTNDCEDTTVPLLQRLQELGIVTHRDNSDWTGPSPQQHALDRALQEPVVQQATWLCHIDIDEFINIRCSDGSLDGLVSRVPQATHIAMSWRLFGHNGVTEITDAPVITQFDHCSPKYCPKPHTVWGFKTLMRNTRAYRQLRAHRPVDLDPTQAQDVTWVTGSGEDHTAELLERGWRTSRKSTGFDLVQLNHYPLRSATAYLVKRARGRALHVNRRLGLNYWIRNDWNLWPDLTIQRHLPRTQAALAGLMADPVLRARHHAGVDWHRDMARTLLDDPKTRALYDLMLAHDFSDMERIAMISTLSTND
jgi:hypothetical protein